MKHSSTLCGGWCGGVASHYCWLGRGREKPFSRPPCFGVEEGVRNLIRISFLPSEYFVNKQRNKKSLVVSPWSPVLEDISAVPSLSAHSAIKNPPPAPEMGASPSRGAHCQLHPGGSLQIPLSDLALVNLSCQIKTNNQGSLHQHTDRWMAKAESPFCPSFTWRAL